LSPWSVSCPPFLHPVAYAVRTGLSPALGIDRGSSAGTQAASDISHTGEDLWKLSDSTEHLPDQAICTTKGGVDFGTNTDQSARDGKLEVVALGV